MQVKARTGRFEKTGPRHSLELRALVGNGVAAAWRARKSHVIPAFAE
jgi:hypothetical protein